MGLPVSTETPLPDALRRPVALRSLSRALDMSFETLRRRVNGLIEQGLVISSDAGVIVPAQRLDELFIANNRRMQTHFDQMLNALVALEQDNVRDRHR